MSWFSLNETQNEVVKRLGPPASIADFGEDFRSWHYHIGNDDHHDYSHYLVFRRSTGKLVSVTRAYEHEQSVDALFPNGSSQVCYHDAAGGHRYGARVRRLSGGRILVAMGSTGPGQPTSQLLLIAEAELGHFHGWIQRQMMASPSTAR